MSPITRANIPGELQNALNAGNLPKAEHILNRYYPSLATNLKYGRCKPLQLKKKIRIQATQLPYLLFQVSSSADDSAIVYQGALDLAAAQQWPIFGLLAYHAHLQELDTPLDQFYLHVGDCHDGTEPVWTACSNQAAHRLIPDSEFLGSRGYQGVSRALSKNPLPFLERQNVLFWRGGVNCREEDSFPWTRNPRLALCQVVSELESPLMTDVKVVGIEYIYQRSEDQIEINNAAIVGQSCPVYSFQKYKYHLDIDGYSNAWSGLFTKLMMGCVIFKIQSPGGYRQWYYDLLVPFVHYIPVKSDLSDLGERIDWALQNEDACIKISNQSRDLSLKIIDDTIINRKS
ncbi:MAG: glycosyl transferase family 90 [Puniceicoccaceae bacterium]